jgi:hypothetical protein
LVPSSPIANIPASVMTTSSVEPIGKLLDCESDVLKMTRKKWNNITNLDD